MTPSATRAEDLRIAPSRVRGVADLQPIPIGRGQLQKAHLHEEGHIRTWLKGRVAIAVPILGDVGENIESGAFFKYYLGNDNLKRGPLEADYICRITLIICS